MKNHYKLSPTQGTIPVNKIVGREKDLKRLDKTLEAQSVLIEEIRRTGKTLFLKKYAHISHKNKKVIYFTLQGIKDVNELIDNLMTDLRKVQSFGQLKIAWNSVKNIYDKVKPDSIDINTISFKLPEWKTKWKEALTACLKDISEREKEEDETLVLILDELPIMIWDWIQNEKAEQAKEFLDVLRRNRQLLEDTGKVRLVICGSIGMQVVLKKLKEEYSYTGEAFNDMASFSIGAMNPKEATFLSNCLFLDNFKKEKDENLDKLLEQINTSAERLPFYINILFTIIRNEFDDVLSSKNITESYNILLNTPKYSKVLKQLEERITIYYAVEEAEIMKSILDYISKQHNGVKEDDLLNKLNLKKRALKESLYILQLENYLTKELKEESNYFSFKYKLVKKWWKINMA